MKEAQARLTQPWHTLFSCVPRLCQPCFDDSRNSGSMEART